MQDRRPGISTGQAIDSEKQAMAKWMRQHMTFAERCFWNEVRRRNYPGLRFRRQQVIYGFIADFYCNELNLVIEIDGGIHEAQKEYDAMRENIIKTKGIRVVRFQNEDVIKRIDWVMSQIVNPSLCPSPKALGEGKGGVNARRRCPS